MGSGDECLLLFTDTTYHRLERAVLSLLEDIRMRQETEREERLEKETEIEDKT